MDTFYVYIHRKPDGTPFYVGKGHGNRAYKLHRALNPWYNAIVKKYGKDNIAVVVSVCDSEQAAFDKERELIARFKALGIQLCNLTEGGEGSAGRQCAEETKQKISVANTGKTPSPATREAMSRSRKGKPLAPDHKRKIGDAHRGRKCSPESVERIRQAQIGKRMSDETKAKQSALRKGIPRDPQAVAKGAAKIVGIPRPESVKQKVSDRLKQLWQDPEYKSKMLANRKRTSSGQFRS